MVGGQRGTGYKLCFEFDFEFDFEFGFEFDFENMQQEGAVRSPLMTGV